jgi:phosphate starvation-inducible PhoH-like protein
LISLDSPQEALALLGHGDRHLKQLRQLLPARLVVRGQEIHLSGGAPEVAFSHRVLSELLSLVRQGAELDPDLVEEAVLQVQKGGSLLPESRPLELNLPSRLKPKTQGQQRYVEAILAHDITFGVGPAGTGKTYLAVAMAVAFLKAKRVKRIVLTRPAVEAGEKLGYLPGDLQAKVDPYLRPLYDALFEMIDAERFEQYLQAGIIEVAPLAFMRGRAQPLKSLVLTPRGWRPMGSLRVGDEVIGSQGKPVPILGVYPQGWEPVYRVTASDGASTLASGDHLWTVLTPEGPRLYTTRALVGVPEGIYELPLLQGPVEFLPQGGGDFYALGRALASSGKVAEATLLVQPPEARLALLQGLLEAKGDVVQGRLRAPATLEEELRFLVGSFGGLVERRGPWLELALPPGIPLGAGTFKRPRRFLRSVTPAGWAETQCLRVAAPDHLYVTEDFLLTHNTLNDAFIILDEAQNTTPEQMKMFLTRLGFRSRVVITGDVTQIDLPKAQKSGLVEALKILAGIEGIAQILFQESDVVRHPLVARIVKAYEQAEVHGSG